MSRFVQVGVSAMRDPVTGELLESVPLYVDADYEPAPVIPAVDLKMMARDLCRQFRAAMARTRKEGSEEA